MKWVLRIVAVLVVIFGGVVVAFLLVPAERIAGVATQQLSAMTGRDVSIKGDVGFTFWPVVGVRASGLEVGNASWSDKGPMFEAANAAIGVDAIALLQGDIRIINIEAQSPIVRLEQQADGRANWLFSEPTDTPQEQATDTPAAASDRSTPAISVQKVKITNANLSYMAAGSAPVSFSGVDLDLDWPDSAGTAEVVLTAQPGNAPVTVAAALDGFAQFLAGETQTLRLSVQTDAGALSFDGKGSTDGAVSGTLDLKTDTTDAFLRALGVAGVDLPENLGRRVDLKTTLALTPDLKLSLRDLVVDLGDNRVAGAADIDLTQVPQINAQLDLGDFNLDMDTGGSDGAGSTTNATTSANSGNANTTSGWSKAPIDASALSAFNGEIAISANSIDLGQFKVGATQALLRNEQSRMVFDLRDVKAYGGTVSGEFVINNRAGLSVGGGLTAKAIQMQPLLSDAADIDRLTGQGDASLTFLGAGASLDAIMRSLSGDGSVSVGRGTIQGIDLDRLMRAGDTGDGTTVFDSLGGTWKIASGVLSNNDLLLQLKNYQASGAGVVGLGTQTVDYTATPVALRANSGQGVSIPVRFTGPWSDVSIRPDLEAAFDAELDAKADELEEKAKEKLNKELGIETQEGQSTEDAVKDKLLRKLFK